MPGHDLRLGIHGKNARLALDVKRVSPRSLSGSRDRPYQGDVGSLMDSSKPTLFSRLLMFVHQFDANGSANVSPKLLPAGLLELS